jgi:hypothetical protein
MRLITPFGKWRTNGIAKIRKIRVHTSLALHYISDRAFNSANII